MAIFQQGARYLCDACANAALHGLDPNVLVESTDHGPMTCAEIPTGERFAFNEYRHVRFHKGAGPRMLVKCDGSAVLAYVGAKGGIRVLRTWKEQVSA